MTSRILFALIAFAIAGQAQAFSSNFTLFDDPNNINRDAGMDGLWGTADDQANNANPFGAVSFVYQNDNGPFAIDSYTGFGIGNFIIDTADSGASSAEYSAMSLFGTTPGMGGLAFQVGSLSLSDSMSSTINYKPGSNNQIFDNTLNLKSFGGSEFNLTGEGYTLYNADGLDDASIFGGGGLFGSDPATDGLVAHLNYLLELAPEAWTAITVNFLDLNDSDLSVVLSSYSVDEDLLPNSSAVPVPAAVWLLGSALIGLINCPRKKSV